jgi:acyl carrier protein
MDSRLVEDLGADSLEILEITLALNDHFGIELPEAELTSVRTTGDLCRWVDRFI